MGGKVRLDTEPIDPDDKARWAKGHDLLAIADDLQFEATADLAEQVSEETRRGRIGGRGRRGSGGSPSR